MKKENIGSSFDDFLKEENIVSVKQLSIDELREQFEEYYEKQHSDFDIRDFERPQGVYIYCYVQELWVYYRKCARANNLIKDGE